MQNSSSFLVFGSMFIGDESSIIQRQISFTSRPSTIFGFGVTPNPQSFYLFIYFFFIFSELARYLILRAKKDRKIQRRRKKEKITRKLKAPVSRSRDSGSGKNSKIPRTNWFHFEIHLYKYPFDRLDRGAYKRTESIHKFH